jgi:hypothetical protein
LHVDVLGDSIIVLNNAKHAINMLNKKSRLYSDRPTFMMASHLIGWEDGLIPLCKTWSECRELYAQFMGTQSKIEAFEGVLQGETFGYLQHILADPVAWVGHTKKCVCSLDFWSAPQIFGCDCVDTCLRLQTDKNDHMVKHRNGPVFRNHQE